MRKKEGFFKKLTSPLVWGNLLAMAFVVGLLFVGLIWWLDEYTHHGEGVEVPDFYGLNCHDAISSGDNLGLVVIVNDSTYVKTLPAGSVVTQTPQAGATVKSGRTVYVTINSLTMPRVAIPYLIDNCSYREAQAKLQALEFNLTPPKLIDGEKDWVYGIQCNGRNLQTGDMVAKESTLTLIIGSTLPDDDMELEEYDDELDEGDGTGGDDEVDTFMEMPEMD